MHVAVVNLRNVNIHEWTRNPNNIYIGRKTKFLERSKWANPFRISSRNSRVEVVGRFEQYLRKNRQLCKDIYQLIGKNLGCWCWPRLCHGNVLKQLVQESLKHQTVPSVMAMNMSTETKMQLLAKYGKACWKSNCKGPPNCLLSHPHATRPRSSSTPETGRTPTEDTVVKDSPEIVEVSTQAITDIADNKEIAVSIKQHNRHQSEKAQLTDLVSSFLTAVRSIDLSEEKDDGIGEKEGELKEADSSDYLSDSISVVSSSPDVKQPVDEYLKSFNISADEERTSASYVDLLKSYHAIYEKWQASEIQSQLKEIKIKD